MESKSIMPLSRQRKPCVDRMYQSEDIQQKS